MESAGCFASPVNLCVFPLSGEEMKERDSPKSRSFPLSGKGRTGEYLSKIGKNVIIHSLSMGKSVYCFIGFSRDVSFRPFHSLSGGHGQSSFSILYSDCESIGSILEGRWKCGRYRDFISSSTRHSIFRQSWIHFSFDNRVECLL